MFERDTKEFFELLDDAWTVNPNWKQLSPKGKALFFKALEPYSLEVVRMALTAHIRDPKRGTFQPVPADIVAQIEGISGGAGRPGVEEAWAIAVLATDEAATVVWTEEMRDAFGICQSLLERGDGVGARMAFKDAYLRLVVEAGRANRPVKWEVTLGHDAARRVDVIRKAEAMGRIPSEQVSLFLPPPATDKSVNRDGLARLKAEVAKLISADVKMAQRQEAARLAEEERKNALAGTVEAYAQAHGIEHQDTSVRSDQAKAELKSVISTARASSEARARSTSRRARQ